MRRRKKPDDLVTASEIASAAYCPEQHRLQYVLGLEPEKGSDNHWTRKSG